MRINIVTGPLLPVPPVAGGSVHRMWWGLARCFAREGHEVTLIARHWPGSAIRETLEGVNMIRWGGFDDSGSQVWNVIRDLLYAVGMRGKLPPADVTVVNDLMLPMLLKRGRAHGALVTNSNRFPKWQHRFYRQVDLIACASTSIAAAIARQAPERAAITAVIPNALDVEQFRVAADPAEPAVVLYVGRINPEKGLETLIDAFAIVSAARPAARLALVGPHETREGGGGATYLSGLRQKAQGLPVEFAGPEFDVRRLAQAYARAAAFCYPTGAETGEALPVAPLEAMAAGCPVVLSDLACFKDYAHPEQNALQFDHRCAEAPRLLAEQILRLLTDSALAARLRDAAFETARGYSYDAVAAQYLATFEDLTGIDDGT